MCRQPKGGDELMDFLDLEDPELVIGSSSCDVSGFLKGSQRALEKANGLSCMCKSLCKGSIREGKGLSA